MNTSGGWAQYLCGRVNSIFPLGYGLTDSCVYHRSINEETGGSQWWVGFMPLGWHVPVTISCYWLGRTFYLRVPIWLLVHTRDREPITQVEKWIYLTTEVLGSNSIHVHALVWLHKAYRWNLIKVEKAVQVSAGLVWSFLIHGSRSPKGSPIEILIDR